MKLFRVFLLAAAISVISGCDLVDNLNENPPHLLTTDRLYASYSGFEAGLNGLYAQVRRERERTPSNSHAMMGGMFMSGTDNMTTNHHTGGWVTVSMYWRDHNHPTNEAYEEVFTWLYGIINAANTIIERAENEEVDWSGGGRSPQENKNRIVGEARAVRAWAYRHLMYGWGDVPLSLEEARGSTIRTDWTRAPVEEVREQIIADLLFAAEHVPVEPSLPGRISKGAVQHYLAEMYILEGEYETAISWTNEVINNGAYRLVTQRYGVGLNEPGVPFMDMFKEGNSNREEGNTEALWVFQFGQNIIGGGGSTYRRTHLSRYWNIRIGDVIPLQLTHERGGLGYARKSATKWALELYEPGDDRGSEHAIRWFFVLKDAEQNAPYPADNLPPGYAYGDTLWLDWSRDLTQDDRNRFDWPFFRKAEGTDPNNMQADVNHNDQVYLRLAETYLLRAEAQFHLGRTGDAAQSINEVRRRANASDITAADVTLDFILDERSRELFYEEHRRWTLLRTGKFLERVRAYNKNGGDLVTERDLLFPIPQSVVDANLNSPMPNNPGY